jgi:hypothetical protein
MKQKQKPILFREEIYNKIEEVRRENGFRTLSEAVMLLLETYKKESIK